MKENILKRSLYVLTIFVLVLTIPLSSVTAQEPYPKRPVQIWVGFPPGGGTDIMVRTLIEGAEKTLGEKIVILNKPGGGGTVCASLIAKEKPDGYTLAAFPDTPVTRTPHLRNLDFDPFRDFSYIIRIGNMNGGFAVRPDSPFKKWEDVVEWAKKDPGQLVFGHPGAGTTLHLAMVKLAKIEGFTFKSVSFPGELAAVTALLGGHVMITGGAGLTLCSQLAGNKLRVLLALEKEGFNCSPDVPTLERLRYNFEVSTSVIICGPKGIPDRISEILAKTFIDRMDQEAYKKLAKREELILKETLTGKALFDYLKQWNVLYGQLVKEAGIYKSEAK